MSYDCLPLSKTKRVEPECTEGNNISFAFSQSSIAFCSVLPTSQVGGSKNTVHCYKKQQLELRKFHWFHFAQHHYILCTR